MRSLILVAALVPLIAILWAIVRFSIVSPKRTAGAATRLRAPDLIGAAKAAGFHPPPEIEEFYLESPLVEMQECVLIDSSKQPPREWPLARFFPISEVDVAERLAVAGLSGVLPIASDLEKGVFAISSNGTVELWTPGASWSTQKVASSILEFSRFESREDVSSD